MGACSGSGTGTGTGGSIETSGIGPSASELCCIAAEQINTASQVPSNQE